MANTEAPQPTYPVTTEDALAQTRTRTYRNGYWHTYRYVVVEQRAGYRVERRVFIAEGTSDGITAKLTGAPAWVVTTGADPEADSFAVFLTRSEAIKALDTFARCPVCGAPVNDEGCTVEIGHDYEDAR